MGYGNGSWGAGEWLAMGVAMAVFWGLVLTLGIWAVRVYRTAGSAGRVSGVGPDAELAERFARGEIEQADFLQRRELLRTASTSVDTRAST